MEDPRVRKLARFVVEHALSVRPGDRVMVELRGREFDVARVFVEEVHAAGGSPLVRAWRIPSCAPPCTAVRPRST